MSMSIDHGHDVDADDDYEEEARSEENNGGGEVDGASNSDTGTTNPAVLQRRTPIRLVLNFTQQGPLTAQRQPTTPRLRVSAS